MISNQNTKTAQIIEAEEVRTGRNPSWNDRRMVVAEAEHREALRGRQAEQRRIKRWRSWLAKVAPFPRAALSPSPLSWTSAGRLRLLLGIRRRPDGPSAVKSKRKEANSGDSSSRNNPSPDCWWTTGRLPIRLQRMKWERRPSSAIPKWILPPLEVKLRRPLHWRHFRLVLVWCDAKLLLLHRIKKRVPSYTAAGQVQLK